MSLRSKRPAKATEAEAAEKPAAGFFDSFEPSGSAASAIDQRQWREDTGSSINYDPSLELQQTIERFDVIGQAQAARQSDRQPTSRERIEHAMRPRSSLRDDSLFHLSTHRAARGESQMSDTERAMKREQQEARAWSMFTWLVSLGAGGR
ncbi:hypothetical protein [Burkholderia cepacia]|uniref:hypothetical protein n=1 Tax=Burkholderia cepacia TaxID=292 RepID=UPI00158AC89D|nr:hypothetical protein [Burkholderia cepacia]MCA8114957.1 hypothetical protein [Burkholderia cepacia]MCA8401412.1 hypothetical protein [Burkholderia cepacia]